MTSKKLTSISALLALSCPLAFAQFSDAVLKTSQRGLRYQEIVVTAKGVIESCVFFSCTTKETPIRGLLWLPETKQDKGNWGHVLQYSIYDNLARDFNINYV